MPAGRERPKPTHYMDCNHIFQRGRETPCAGAFELALVQYWYLTFE